MLGEYRALNYEFGKDELFYTVLGYYNVDLEKCNKNTMFNSALHTPLALTIWRIMFSKINSALQLQIIDYCKYPDRLNQDIINILNNYNIKFENDVLIIEDSIKESTFNIYLKDYNLYLNDEIIYEMNDVLRRKIIHGPIQIKVRPLTEEEVRESNIELNRQLRLYGKRRRQIQHDQQKEFKNLYFK